MINPDYEAGLRAGLEEAIRVVEDLESRWRKSHAEMTKGGRETEALLAMRAAYEGLAKVRGVLQQRQGVVGR